MRWRPRRHEPLTIELDFSTPADDVDFAHESERQFARLLDFYGIEWHYEPRSFPIEFDEDGEPAKYFTPDFYLAADDLFIEITTMSQKLVTKKNRKIRLLRESPRRTARSDCSENITPMSDARSSISATTCIS